MNAAHFRLWLLEQRYAPTTVRIYLSYIERASTTLGGPGALKRATPAQLKAWMLTLPATAPSWNGARRALGVYYRAAGRRPSPVLADELDFVPEQIRLPRPISEGERTRFMDAARRLGGDHAVIGLLFATTGCRFAELQRARWVDLDLDGATWRISGKGAQRRGPKPRQAPLRADVIPALVAWRRSSGSPEWLLSGGSRAGHISEYSLRVRFAEVCEVAGLEGVTPHMLRHTVATLALDRTNNLVLVADLLGHDSMSTTQRYTKVLPHRLRELVEALPA